jgi:hypothetical protein
MEEGYDKDKRKHGADTRGNEGIDDSAITRSVAVVDPVQERREDADDNDGADELPDAQAH